MYTSLRGFGQLFQVYRRERGLTQQELASLVGRPTNRSVVAHLEQGLRLPPPAQLEQLCTFLKVPKGLWRLFFAPGFQRARTVVTPRLPPIPRFQFIGIAGITGSGKTTLAKSIARAFSLPYLPNDGRAKRYLSDLASDPGRWAFETQLAFLTTKALEITKCVDLLQPAVLDRTLSEDAAIYAEYFRRHGHLDPRAGDTYSLVASYFLDTLPSPDVVIYCDCPPEVAAARVAARGRSDHMLHDQDYLQDTHLLYKDWIRNYHDSSLFSLDAVSLDWRDPLVVQQVCQDLEGVLLQASLQSQIDLFDDPITSHGGPHQPQLTHLRPLNVVTLPLSDRSTAIFPTAQQRFAPTVYIAAPFTGQAADVQPTATDGDMFQITPPHGVIPKGAYRTLLFTIERVFRDWGMLTILPHRDVNRWGRKILIAADAMAACSQHVSGCDLFVGLLGSSTGAHYEFGLARGLGKPSIIIRQTEFGESFLASGVEALEDNDTLVVRCSSTRELDCALRSDDVRRFVLRNVGTSRVTRGEDHTDDIN